MSNYQGEPDYQFVSALASRDSHRITHTARLRSAADDSKIEREKELARREEEEQIGSGDGVNKDDDVYSPNQNWKWVGERKESEHEWRMSEVENYDITPAEKRNLIRKLGVSIQRNIDKIGNFQANLTVELLSKLLNERILDASDFLITLESKKDDLQYSHSNDFGLGVESFKLNTTKPRVARKHSPAQHLEYAATEYSESSAIQRLQYAPRKEQYVCKEKMDALFRRLDRKIQTMIREDPEYRNLGLEFNEWMKEIAIPSITSAEARLATGEWKAFAVAGNLRKNQVEQMFIGISVFIETLKAHILSALTDPHDPLPPEIDCRIALNSIRPNGLYWTDGVARFLQLRRKEFIIGGSRTVTGRGWCQYNVKIFLESPTLYSYARKAPVYARTSGVAILPNHKPCKPERCAVNDNKQNDHGDLPGEDPKNPPSKHHDGKACSCGIPIALGMVAPMLRKGKVPVVRVNHGREGFNRMSPAELLRYNIIEVLDSHETHYIAFSHVWADGLGSRSERGFPRCTMKRLQRLVEILPRSYSGASFWMDSLCVPKEDKEAKNEAIKRMASAYSNASAVVVLDSGIMEMSINAPIEEQLFRILNCGWMQRLWTLQEGMLARELFFVFAGNQLKTLRDFYTSDQHLDVNLSRGPLLRDLRLYSLDFMYQYHRVTRNKIGRGSNANESGGIFSFATASISRLFGGSQSTTPVTALDYENFGFSHVCQLIWNRTTSRQEDETLAIAGLLNIRADLLTKTDKDHRVSKLLTLVKKLPSDIVFLPRHGVPRNPSPNFSWAPKSFLGSRQYPRLSTDYSATCTSKGLHTRHPTIILKKYMTFRGGEHLFIWIERIRAKYGIFEGEVERLCFWVQPIVSDEDNENTSGNQHAPVDLQPSNWHQENIDCLNKRFNGLVTKDDPWTCMKEGARDPNGLSTFVYTNALLVDIMDACMCPLTVDGEKPDCNCMAEEVHWTHPGMHTKIVCKVKLMRVSDDQGNPHPRHPVYRQSNASILKADRQYPVAFETDRKGLYLLFK